MRYIPTEPRNQSILFPEMLDDYISKDNPIRFIDAFIDGLDLKELDFTHAETKDIGRMPYNPSDLLKLFVYGYLNKIRSSRKLEQLTHRNIEVMWLVGKLRPDFKTIANFRKDNTAALKSTCKEFTLLCKRLNLFGGDLIAVDGSKFKAVNNKNKAFTKKQLKAKIKKIDVRIDKYFKALDRNDNAEKDIKKLTTQELNEKIESLKSSKHKFEDIDEQLEKSGENQVSLTDADSRLMKTPKGIGVCYNVQIATDSKHKLIPVHEVTNAPTDKGQLSKMALKTKEELGVEKLEVLADTGYYHEEEIKKCDENKIECFVPKPRSSNNEKKGMYTKDDFTYEAEKDCYICPAGQELIYRSTVDKEGKKLKMYSTSFCKKCSLKSKCTEAERGRRISRWVDEEIVERMREKMAQDKGKYLQRQSLVEHPFGTLKFWMNHDSFLMRGLENVRGEMSLSILSYNLKRVMNILSMDELLLAVK